MPSNSQRRPLKEVYHAADSLGIGPSGAAWRDVAKKTCQIHGGIGFTWEHDLHLFYKRTKLSEVLLGDPTYHRERVARMVVDGAV